MINIVIKSSIKAKSRDAAFVSFDFDYKVLALVKEQPTRYWHADSKQWEIPADNLVYLLDSLTAYDVTIEGTRQTLHTTAPKVNSDDTFVFKTQPFTHQIDGFRYGLLHNNFLLGDEQGLGKTKQAIDIAVARKQALGYKHCLIVCGVNGLKYNWMSEVKTHSDESAHILGNGKKGRAITNKSKLDDLNNLPDSYFLITNIESLRNKEINDKLAQLIDNNIIEMVVIDEIHKCKNPASQQGKALLALKPRCRIALTGTPLMNSPLDIYIILRWLGVVEDSFFRFRNHYAVMGGYGGYEVVGYRNLDELQTQLDKVMLRRLKKDVLDLPAKIYTTEYVEMSKEQASVYAQIKEELRKDIDKIVLSPNPLAQLLRLRQVTGYPGIVSSSITDSAKLERLEEIIDELAANNEKAIVFSNWTQITDPVYERLARFNPAIITGSTKDREAEKERFMQDPSCKVIIGTIGAMGTGLTLTAATTVIFLDSPWNRANKEQAEDRAHRIGTKGAVNIITLVCKDTIDERIEELIYKKGKMSDVIVDKEVDLTKKDTVAYLLT